MLTHTITRSFTDAPPPHLGDSYEFVERGDERFTGEVCGVVALAKPRFRLTLSMTADEYARMLAAQG